MEVSLRQTELKLWMKMKLCVNETYLADISWNFGQLNLKIMDTQIQS